MGPGSSWRSPSAATGTLAELVTRSAEETEAAGEAFAAGLGPGDLLLLAGDLGAGKTTFVRGLARGLGATATVQSPTFTLVRVYPGRVQLAHVDLYRLERGGELDDLGLSELLEEGVVAIEWGDRLRVDDPVAARGARRIDFSAPSPQQRVIRLP
jgi:tRNA threonylcarbamoyladenosine biosynthesis protein TsaE